LLRRKEITIKNVRRQNCSVEDTINLLASGKVNIDPLITHRLPLDDAKEAFDLVAGYEDGVVKAMIVV
jgi:L-iditol 2-dehydrogenase